MSPFLPALLWAPSAILAAWLWAPHPAACLGAGLGCLSALALSRGESRLWTGLIWGASCLVGLALLFVLSNVALAEPGTQILARAGVVCWLVAHTVLLAIHRFGQNALLPLEFVLFVAPWVLLLRTHRQGHLDRPVDLMEPLQAWGLDPLRFLATVGIFLGISLLLLMGARGSKGPKLATLLFVLALAVLVCLFLPSQKLLRLGTQAERLLGPGQVQEQTVPTTPIAVIVFYSDHQPELGIYHFRPQGQPTEGSRRQQGRPLRYRVAEIVAQDRPLLLGWDGQSTPVAVPDGQTFAAVYDMHSTVPSESLFQRLHDPAPKFDGVTQPPSPIRALAEQAVPPEDRRHPLRAAARIKLWMEQNRAQGAESRQGSVEDCLLQRQAVNQETFTRAAQRLLFELGVASELVSGYAVRADQKGTGSFLLLTEQDRRWWIELTDPGYAGLEFDLHPLDSPSQNDGPENLDMQRRLGELARARQPRERTLGGLTHAGSVGLAVFFLGMLSSGYGWKLVRRVQARVVPANRSAWAAYRCVLDHLAEVEELRRTGETRYEFSQRLHQQVPSLEPLTKSFQRSILGPPSVGEPNSVRQLFLACLSEIAHSYPRRRRWLGALHPFSWLKVR